MLSVKIFCQSIDSNKKTMLIEDTKGNIKRFLRWVNFDSMLAMKSVPFRPIRVLPKKNDYLFPFEMPQKEE